MGIVLAKHNRRRIRDVLRVNTITPARGGRVLRIKVDRDSRGVVVDLWFVVGLDDDHEAAKAVARPHLSAAKIEIVGVLTADVAARWKLRHGEVRPPPPGMR